MPRRQQLPSMRVAVSLSRVRARQDTSLSVVRRAGDDRIMLDATIVGRVAAVRRRAHSPLA